MSSVSSVSSVSAESAVLPATTRLGPVELTVSDLARSVPFYRDVIGLEPTPSGRDRVALAAGGEDVLVLVAEPGARPAGRHAGLYHVALLFPSRLALARVGLRIVAARTPIQGASDHGTHEAIYLEDPDGNGLELAADRPRDAWPDVSDLLAGGPQRLDTTSLLALAAGEPVPNRAGGVVTGHVHLHVGDLEAAKRFYRDLVGFEVQVEIPSAVFLAAGGYHHHVGVNTWRGAGVGPAPAGVAGLRHFTVLLPDGAELGAALDRLRAGGVDVSEAPGGGSLVRDPSGNALLLARDPVSVNRP